MLLESSILYRDRDNIGQSASRKSSIWLRRKLKLDFFLEFNVCNEWKFLDEFWFTKVKPLFRQHALMTAAYKNTTQIWWQSES